MRILEDYITNSGQYPNLAKSGLFLSKTATIELQNRICLVMGIRKIHTNTTYLGNSLVIQQNKYGEFNHLLEKIAARPKVGNQNSYPL